MACVAVYSYHCELHSFWIITYLAGQPSKIGDRDPTLWIDKDSAKNTVHNKGCETSHMSRCALCPHAYVGARIWRDGRTWGGIGDSRLLYPAMLIDPQHIQPSSCPLSSRSSRISKVAVSGFCTHYASRRGQQYVMDLRIVWITRPSFRIYLSTELGIREASG